MTKKLSINKTTKTITVRLYVISFIMNKNYTVLCFFNIIVNITGIPNSDVMTFKGNCVDSDITEKNSIMKIPNSIFKIHCCQSFAGLKSILQKCGTTIPINKIGPKNAVTEAARRDEEMITKYFNCVKFTPKLWA